MPLPVTVSAICSAQLFSMSLNLTFDLLFLKIYCIYGIHQICMSHKSCPSHPSYCQLRHTQLQ
jgi:hypothetical protein